jgi:hypothetical protein
VENKLEVKKAPHYMESKQKYVPNREAAQIHAAFQGLEFTKQCDL